MPLNKKNLEAISNYATVITVIAAFVLDSNIYIYIYIYSRFYFNFVFPS